MKTLTDEILSKVIKPRPENSHKGDYGRLLLIGGNARYGGAIILAASAAVYSGAGLVTVACSLENKSPLHARLPEAMCLDFDSELDEEMINSANVILIGPGLGLERPELVERVLRAQGAEQWLIIDGSAIGAGLVLNFPEKVVFTPHQRELERLSGIEIAEQTEQAFTDEIGATLVAKSNETKIFRPFKEAEKLTIGTPAQATGGMGDTLAGMIAGFLGQFPESHAVSAAVYLHSKIASELAETQYVVLPSHIIEKIPCKMRQSLL